MMKGKEVHMEKLFSLEKYNNERIGFIAEVEEGENMEKVAGELHFIILDIEECLSAYRKVLDELDFATSANIDNQSRIHRLKKEIANMKVKIEELVQLAEKGDVDARLQHACSRQSYKDMQKQIAEAEKEQETIDKQIKKLVESKQELRERIKNGNFSLGNIDIPHVQRRSYY